MYLLRFLRKSELQQRSGRYLLYAFGEILLIVIGIMIALQINNWSQHQTNLELERNFLLRFQVDLAEDLATFREQVELGEKGLEAVKEGVELIHRTNVEEDFFTLNRYYDLAHIDPFSPQYSTYEELESTGQLNLIRDNSLRLAIQKHYAEYHRMEVHFEQLYTWRKNVTNIFETETASLKYTDWNVSIFPAELRSDTDWNFMNDKEHSQFKVTETAFAATSFWITWHMNDYEEIIPITEALKERIAKALEDL